MVELGLVGGADGGAVVPMGLVGLVVFFYICPFLTNKVLSDFKVKY